LVGVVAALIYVALTRAQPEPFAYIVAHALKLVGGACGGFVAQELSGDSALIASPQFLLAVQVTTGAFRLQRDVRVGGRTRRFLSVPSSSPALARIQLYAVLPSFCRTNDLRIDIKVKRMVYLSDRSDLLDGIIAQHNQVSLAVGGIYLKRFSGFRRINY
jgi:hypothetical protein